MSQSPSTHPAPGVQGISGFYSESKVLNPSRRQIAGEENRGPPGRHAKALSKFPSSDQTEVLESHPYRPMPIRGSLQPEFSQSWHQRVRGVQHPGTGTELGAAEPAGAGHRWSSWAWLWQTSGMGSEHCLGHPRGCCTAQNPRQMSARPDRADGQRLGNRWREGNLELI